MRKKKIEDKNVIKIAEDVKINDEIILEAGDKIEVLNGKNSEILSYTEAYGLDMDKVISQFAHKLVTEMVAIASNEGDDPVGFEALGEQVGELLAETVESYSEQGNKVDEYLYGTMLMGVSTGLKNQGYGV